MSMYRVSTNPAGEKQWWSPDDTIPTSHRFIRSATYEETVIIDEILKEDAEGKMPSERWGRLITTLMNKKRMYVLFTGGNNIFLTGPFRTYTEAGDYGAIAEKRLWNNDPNWACIDLSYPHGLRVDTPVDFDAEPQKYIVVIRETEVYLVGPFADSLNRCDYGATAQRELWNDDPHWTTLNLRYPSETGDLRIEAPADIKVVLGAYNLACGLNANGSKIDHEASDTSGWTLDDTFLISEEAAARMAETDIIECKITGRYGAKGVSLYPDENFLQSGGSDDNLVK